MFLLGTFSVVFLRNVYKAYAIVQVKVTFTKKKKQFVKKIKHNLLKLKQVNVSERCEINIKIIYIQNKKNFYFISKFTLLCDHNVCLLY